MKPPRESQFIVKVCGITNEADARTAADAGANAIGLNFYRRSPRCINADAARAIAGAIPTPILRVGVFVNETADNIAAIAERVALDVVQVYGRVEGDLSGLRVWRAVPVDEQFPQSLESEIAAEAYLLDAPTNVFGGSGRTFDWSRIVELPQRIVLAGGLDASNVGEAISVVHPWGVDACSRLEVSPGKKDAQKVREFVAAALRANSGGARPDRSEVLEQKVIS